MTDFAAIHSSDFWVKVVEMLQNNWALIEADARGTRVYFIKLVGERRQHERVPSSGTVG